MINFEKYITSYFANLKQKSEGFQVDKIIRAYRVLVQYHQELDPAEYQWVNPSQAQLKAVVSCPWDVRAKCKKLWRCWSLWVWPAA